MRKVLRKQDAVEKSVRGCRTRGLSRQLFLAGVGGWHRKRWLSWGRACHRVEAPRGLCRWMASLGLAMATSLPLAEVTHAQYNFMRARIAYVVTGGFKAH